MRDNSTSFADNEPPFFLRNPSSSETPPNRQQQSQNFSYSNNGSNSLPIGAGLLQFGNEGSSAEDFRGVIDDLTIENKKLKRRLRKYEKLHDAHLKDEKLFEVRIHGLPSNRKRELEETLRKFASSLELCAASAFPANGYEGLVPLLESRKTNSSQISVPNADSAYASMSASGQGSSARSGNDSLHKTQAPSAASRLKNIHSNVHSYLHRIPEGLLPQPNPATMTERAKQRLVVSRLEQVFAGKGAAALGHQQPLQQQEVSQSAAKDERSAMEAQGQLTGREGSREACIVFQDSTDDEDIAKEEVQTISLNDSAMIQQTPAKIGEQDFAPPKTQTPFEQRPTRPLDLDPHRAQVPAENIHYMRHLGFSPPDPHSSAVPEEGHGWIYLNLLINMAQLHTISVTTDFVRKSLSDYSAKLELSQDGRKVRWRGSRLGTQVSSHGNSSHHRISASTPDGQSPRKRAKLSHNRSVRSGMSSMRQAYPGATQRSEKSKFVYSPLFFHRDSTDDEDDSSFAGEEDSSTSPMAPYVGGESSGMTGSGIRTTVYKKNKNRDDGPIIFYSNARFCTDLSGDQGLKGNTHASQYIRATSLPIGACPPTPEVHHERRGPLLDTANLPEPMDLADNPIPESMELTFPPSSPLQSESALSPAPVQFEVTGIGGVWPADHFAINVESRHARIDQTATPERLVQVFQRSFPTSMAQILDNSRSTGMTRAAVHEQLLSARHESLPPSELPPALSFMPFGEESVEGDDSDDEDEMSISPESPDALTPSAAPQAIDMLFDESEESEESDDDGCDDDESDGSLDLLAAAGQVDPEAVRAREREYDANMAERLAEEIQAGSSAATAGGGSGFVSPATDIDRQAYRRAIKDVRALSTSLQSGSTDGSMAVQGMDDSHESDEDDNDETGDTMS